MQWHPTILTKLALVPQGVFNSYPSLSGSVAEEGAYKDGDFVLTLHGCDVPERNCEKEFVRWWGKRMMLE